MVRMSLDRRQFLTRTGAAAVGAAGTLGVPVIADAAAKASKRGSAGRTDPLLADGTLQRAVVSDPSARLPAVPFRGRHQAGAAPITCSASSGCTSSSGTGCP